MADIIQEFTIRATPAQVFSEMATGEGLAHWWTKTSAGRPQLGAPYRLTFSPEYDWQARVTRCEPDSAFELELTEAHEDWTGTRVGCELEAEGSGTTRVRFHHRGWPVENEHWRVSCYCWAMYLRILRRYLEHGERVPYEKRLDV